VNNKNQTYVLLELPSKVEYALLALLEMGNASDSKKPLTDSENTSKHPIPERYLEQIMATLRRGGLIKSLRGAKGGYILARSPHQITLLEVVALIEGEQQTPDNTDSFTIEMKLIRQNWQKANLAAQSVLEKYTLQDLYDQRESYLQKNLMYYI